jgi:hypothetical protein
MANPDLKTTPRAGDVWLSRPPYLYLAHILAVDEQHEPPVVSYVLQDEDGLALETVSHARLDRGWWHSFQPIGPGWG